jgi:hypothetical protein
MSERRRPASGSERPPEDLKKERDAFIQQFFRKGAQLTEELVRENERLRERVAEIEADNGKLRAHLASDNAIRDLLRKIEDLEDEKAALLTRTVQVEAITDEFTNRQAEVETELSRVANLYVATSQLHAASSVRGVLRSVKEILAQFVGAGSYAVYLAADGGDELLSVASEGANASEIARLPASNGPVGDAFRSATLREKHGDPTRGTMAEPAAVVPLAVDGRTVGAIAIFSTLPQKTEWTHVDRELFKLLGAQVVPALVNARLFTGAGRKVPSAEAFLDLED